MEIVQKFILTDVEIQSLKNLAKIDCSCTDCDCDSVSCPLRLRKDGHYCMSVLASDILRREGIAL